MTTSAGAQPFDTADAEERESPTLLGRMREFFREHGFGLVLALLLVAFTIVVLWPRMVITVRAGEVGVLWYRFTGTDLDTSYYEGTHLILPWNVMTVYDTRINKVDYEVPVLSTDGLEITVAVTIRFRPVAKTVSQLHQQIGPEYVGRIVIPEVVTAVREVMGLYRPEQLYTLRTVEMQNQIVSRAMTQVQDRFVVIDDVLIRRISLPEAVQQAIQNKLRQEQEALEYQFRLQKERSEAQRKIIEADGIAEYQKRIAAGLTDAFLRYKGVEATLELAKSPNSKVIVVGPGNNGLPVILNPGQ